MRILNVIHSLNPLQGGPSEGLRQLVVAYGSMGHAHQVLTLDAPGEHWLADFPAQVHAAGPAMLSYGYSPRLVPWLREHAREFDAVIVHGLWQYHGFGTRRALRGLGVPYFVFCHGMLDPWFKREYPIKHLKKWLYWPWAEYRVLRDASAVLFTAEEESRLAPQSFALYRARHAVVGFGLQLDATARAADAGDFLAAFPAVRGKRIVLFLGRIHPKKGCDLLIEAFARVAAEDPGLHLVMAGPDQVDWQRALERQADGLGVAGRITWCGMLRGPLKWAAYSAADVFVLPSHQENFGIVVAEALAVGLPVLTSNQVNIWREVVDGGAGFAAQDDLAGTEALLRRWLATPPAERQAMRERARRCFELNFDMRAAARRFLDVLRGAGAAV